LLFVNGYNWLNDVLLQITIIKWDF